MMLELNQKEKELDKIAQETELIISEVVGTGDDGLKRIEYQILVGPQSR